MSTQGRRWPVFSRVMAAVAGGYITALAVNAALAILLPLPRAEAVTVAAMLAYPVFAGAIIWAFAARSASRAWGGLALIALPCAAFGIWQANHPPARAGRAAAAAPPSAQISSAQAADGQPHAHHHRHEMQPAGETPSASSGATQPAKDGTP